MGEHPKLLHYGKVTVLAARMVGFSSRFLLDRDVHAAGTSESPQASNPILTILREDRDENPPSIDRLLRR